MQLLGSSWIAGLLEETRLRLPKEGMHRIEGLAEPQCMELRSRNGRN